MNTKQTSLFLILSLAFFVVCFCAVLFFFTKVEAHKVSFIEKTNEEIKAKATKNALEKITKTLDETKQDRESLLSRFPKDEDVVDLLASIETLGREQGVTLTTNSLTVKPIDATFETLVIATSVQGTYGNVLHMLKLLEGMPYQVGVANVQFSRSGEKGSEWNMNCEIRITKFKKV